MGFTFFEVRFVKEVDSIAVIWGILGLDYLCVVFGSVIFWLGDFR